MKASVIITSYNAEERLYYNLISLNQQDCNFEDFEVIVIDNGSNDNTLEMVKNFKADFNLKFGRVEKNRGIAHGRNEAIKLAEGDILIFHDSDMIAPKDFVSKHLNHHQEKNIVACGISWKRVTSFYYEELERTGINYDWLRDNIGYFEKINKNPIISEESIVNGSYMNYVYDLDSDFTRVLKNILSEYGGRLDEYLLPWRLFITNNASVERKRVLDVGMFDEAIVGYGFEDYDLGFRLYKSGGKFIYDENILNVHQDHPTNINITELNSNTNYMCNKYNNLYFIDGILVWMSYATSIDHFHLNELIKEINMMMGISEFKPILETFLSLLQVRRSVVFKDFSVNNYEIVKGLDIKKTVEEMNRLEKVVKTEYFTKAMVAIINNVYN